MSTDARYILEYEMQGYAGGFPHTDVDNVNKELAEYLYEPFTRVPGYHLTFVGMTKHTHGDTIRRIAKADQVLECRDGELWREVPPSAGKE